MLSFDAHQNLAQDPHSLDEVLSQLCTEFLCFFSPIILRHWKSARCQYFAIDASAKLLV